MKRLLLSFALIAIFSLPAICQTPVPGEVVEEQFKATTVPDKWKDESAVIIGMKEEYLFKRKTAGNKLTPRVEVTEFVHKRIKLQDKNAVEKFSTFYYVTIGKDGKAVYQVIKKDGKQVDIDMKTAIEEEQDIPDFYKPIYYKLKLKSYKIAIPDLEVGDIVDYTLYSNLDWDMKEEGINFTPFIFSLSNTYPTMYQQYRFTMANGMKVKYRSFNGAPNLKFDPKSSVYGEKDSYLSYYFLDADREKSLDERWSVELRSTPSVKFRVVFLDYEPGDKSLGEATVDRSGLDIQKVYRGYAGAALMNTPVVTSLVAYTTQYITKKKADGELKAEDEIIKETYYCLRKVFLEMYYKGPVHSELEKYFTGKKIYKKNLANEAKNAVKEEKEDEIRVNGPTFATALRASLAAQGIASELFVYVPRKLGTWRDAIFLEELDYVMRVKIKGKPYFLDAFNNFDAFGTPYSYLESAEGYSIRYDEVDSYYKTSVAPTPATANYSGEEYHVDFNESLDNLKVERISTYTGAEKTPYIGMANLDRAYLAKDFEHFYAEPLSKSKKKDEPVAGASDKSYVYEDQAEQEKERLELFEKAAKTDLDLDKYSKFELMQDGRTGDTAALQFKENFTVKKLVSKAGKNYIFEAGKLIGGQIKLEPKEMTGRQSDIYLPNARVIENKIVINVPAGYTVDGLQDFNMNIDNASGSFVSKAELVENAVEITTKKVYKNNYDKKEAWPNYIAFLEPAYKLSQAKIVLKKK